MFAYTLISWQQGQAAAVNATSNENIVLDYSVLPRVTFCDPEVAGVGMSEKQARERGFKVKVGRFDYSNLTRAIVSDETQGMIKIIAEEGTGRVLGGHIAGIEASTMIHEIAVAIKNGMTVSDIGDTFHAYPTLSDGIRYACMAAK
jgi:pyruvate/2-oxoglutarate dehydrogenase complex dihydrolipoamide dehydrogenase (E3) component